jgi:hypothetical protein
MIFGLGGRQDGGGGMSAVIGAVGPRELGGGTLQLVERELAAVLERCAAGATFVVRAGAGLPLVVGRAVRAAGRRLVVALPAHGHLPAPLPQRDRTAAGELLLLAEHVRLMAFDPADRDACVGADEQLVAGCGRLLAIWDGSPSSGRDATAHLVAFARSRQIPVDVLWPAGEPEAAR